MTQEGDDDGGFASTITKRSSETHGRVGEEEEAFAGRDTGFLLEPKGI